MYLSYSVRRMIQRIIQIQQGKIALLEAWLENGRFHRWMQDEIVRRDVVVKRLNEMLFEDDCLHIEAESSFDDDKNI